MNNSVWIDHRHNFEYEVVTELKSILIVAGEVINDAFYNV
jgi:hypothetical protein